MWPEIKSGLVTLNTFEREIRGDTRDAGSSASSHPVISLPQYIYNWWRINEDGSYREHCLDRERHSMDFYRMHSRMTPGIHPSTLAVYIPIQPSQLANLVLQ